MIIERPPQANYRPDIDGLRAIAVLAVIIFHLFQGYLGAGFLGVDIFFVISGFLITTILVRECEEGRYSILAFYGRRIRRILPALLIVILTVSIVTAFLYLPADLIGYSRSVLAAFLFVSNIYFWRDTDYFSLDAHTKPLLHTWSLGIEEQFYIFFPLLVVLVMRLGNRRGVLVTTAAVTIMSFILTIVTLELNKSIVAFYLLPMRAWELGIGAILALLPQRERKASLSASIVAGLGFALLIAALSFPDPSAYAPLPAGTFACAATALLIRAGAADNVFSRILALRPLVWIGLISYSLYLWHWPAYVLARYVLIREPGFWESCLIALLSLILAAASWRYVERPFRSRAMPISTVLWISGIGVGMLTLTSVIVIWQNGFPHRFDARAAAFNAVAGTHYRCPVSSYLRFGGAYACPVNLPGRDSADADVVILGNSHSQMYVPAIEPELRRRQLAGLLVPANGCIPVAAFNISLQCAQLMEQNIAGVVALPRARLVIIAFSWDSINGPMVNAAGKPVGRVRWADIREELEATIRKLSNAGKRVIIVGPIPNPGYDIASVIGREIAFRGAPRSPLAEPRAQYDRRYAAFDSWIAQRPAGALGISPSRLFCGAKACSFLLNGRPAYADDNHLSANMVGAFSPLFGAAIDEATGGASYGHNGPAVQ